MSRKFVSPNFVEAVAGRRTVFGSLRAGRASVKIGTAMAVIMLALACGVVGANNGVVSATSSALSIGITGTPTINLSPTTDGRFAYSDDATISVVTTHAAGYTLTAKATGANDPTSLRNSDGSVKLESISSAIDASVFNTSDYNGKWGYKPSSFSSAGTVASTITNTDYRPSPGTGAADSPVDTLAVTNNNNDGSYTISIGARVDINTAIDSYSNTFVFAVTANATPYTLNYIDNSNEATNMPTNITDGTSAAEGITLSSTEPEREGYTFAGWCTTTTSDDTCSGTTYNAGDTYNLNQTATTNVVNLYAMWKAAGGNDLYSIVAGMVKKNGNTEVTQTLADLKTAITTDNSGVYKYDPSTFGASSDASNDNAIYYYRGILDSNLDGTQNTYGSNGDGAAWPNYVILQAGSTKATTDTCWRIVRTTGSGGVKMIYNGLWTGSTCAHATTTAQVTTQAYAEKGTSSQSSYWYRNIHYVGYTFNNSVTDSTTDTAVDTVFGSNSNYSTTNTTSSAIKKYIENTWFSGSNGISAFENILEPSAGYCNDRTAYSNQSTSPTALTQIAPYKTSSATMYFGANERNFVNDSTGPTLTCPRGTVDLYTTSAASNGNKQLSKPVALLTADESALAGSGRSSGNPTVYHYNSYLRSGSYFWLLSPDYRNSGGNASGFSLRSGGLLYSSTVYNAYGVRPVISLTSGTSAASGTGTAADPWVVNP